MLKEGNKPATSEFGMWLYASRAYSRNHIRIFEYQPNRSGKRPKSFLKGFAGCLVIDRYAGYNQMQKVTHYGCWVHARRKWWEAMPGGAKLLMPLPEDTRLFMGQHQFSYAPEYRLDRSRNLYMHLACLEAAVEAEGVFACDEEG